MRQAATSRPLPAAELDERSGMLATVLATVDALVLAMDAEGRIQVFNGACERVSGYRFDEVRGRYAWDVVLRPADVEPVKGVFRRLSAGQRSTYENVWVAKDGTERLIAWSNAVQSDPDGRVRFVVATGIDVTELRQTERALAENERRYRDQLTQAAKLEAIGRLAGGVAHDFNNLLTVILGCAGALCHELPAGHPLREEAEEIAAAGGEAARLTRQLLEFARQRPVQPVPVVLNHTVEEMTGVLARLLGDELQLATALAPDLGRVVADPTSLRQVILNLVVNARDAMAGGAGTISIQTENAELGARDVPGVPAGRYALLSVRDTGCGMSAETRSHLFEPFFTTKPEGCGTGLGLATVFGAVKQAGGHVLVESAEGEGACFRIYLPLA
ncbi:two-component system sensor histidine kinase NtrB [Anaeromyxobacter diazotrophicus]|uniref:histidine kinase n=1 Tax=Anaeromyxobacter diazotrophicus TaxID=2590199 RepID=A0A7I9VQC1_9BACT|nr:ATP-binding protein [Anaeromyxobacter diazotrophicus]GEJ58612.1 hypothetical protein AMYX_33530 [Anaeromyxobacter diazotrophicus]